MSGLEPVAHTVEDIERVAWCNKCGGIAIVTVTALDLGVADGPSVSLCGKCGGRRFLEGMEEVRHA